jgi:hypothetical protein
MKVLAPLLLACCFGAVASSFAQSAASPGSAQDRSPREEMAALNALQLDSASIYKVVPANRIALREGDIQFTFDEGWIAFFLPWDGRVTGAVFAGRGHILAAPRNIVEKQQLAFFLGAPILDQDFYSAYLRFTDDAADVFRRQFREASLIPEQNDSLIERWKPVLAQLNPVHAMRLYSERLTRHPRPYFYAGLDGAGVGRFDVIYDQAREEPVLIGQVTQQDNSSFYNVWASYRLPGFTPPSAAFRAQSYVLDTSIRADNSVQGSAVIRIQARTEGDRLVVLQLSRDLDVDSVTGDAGQAFPWFHNNRPDGDQRSSPKDDLIYVVLPGSFPAGETFILNLRYHGNVIRDAGNGVLFVGDRDSWYPRLGGNADFASYELTMRWPRRLRLTATGTKLDEHEDGDFRVAHWRTEKPVSVAGFNLGEYAFASLPSQGYSVDVYANRQLEQALLNRLHPLEESAVPRISPPFGFPVRSDRFDLPAITPSPADALKQLGKEIDSSIQFYGRYCGPFPFQHLSVSQIPGTFGQGWPGLLYLSTYSFLPAQTQLRAGLSSNSQEHFSELVPFHEVAHQWWGNIVGWSSYRDQWIDEALANYLALLYADSQKSPDHKLRAWLERYRDQLTQKSSGSDIPPADFGALTLGSRLTSSKSPDGFERVIYAKGSWIIHMLREMLRQPGAKDPDARFVALLHTLMANYSYKALTTADLQREVEAVMTPSMDIEDSHSMDWFFDEWVRGVGIPHYRLEYNVRSTGKGFLIRGKIYQTGVPRSFVAPIPLYAANGGYLGRVIAGGPETSFHFLARKAPGKISVDPRMTLLCVVER